MSPDRGEQHSLSLMIDHCRAFYALLELSICKDFVWCLIGHKHADEFGHKILKSVTVFRPGDPPLGHATGGDGAASSSTPPSKNIAQWPALMFEVVDYSRELHEQSLQLESTYYDSDQDVYMPLPNIAYPTVP
jgi:hypothetical protein